jgi:hypothetical protein
VGSPYRQTYRVEERIRALTDEEAARAHPERGQAREVIVVARSVVGALDEDDHYSTWLLFEIPGEPWFIIANSVLPPGHPSVARAELRFVFLHPSGATLSVEATGDAIPHRGATLVLDDGPGYSDAVDLDQWWRPSPDVEWAGIADGRIPERALPGWVRQLAGTG